ncbi:MAG: DUF1850 domain-containing protein [Marinobacter sp.]|nr:DUF1850 domain-containing protein [Marinobacter sp.]
MKRSLFNLICSLVCLLSWTCASMAAGQAPASDWQLTVTGPDQTRLARIALPATGRWCLIWNHSVQGFEVTDCFRVVDGQLELDSTHTPDFAAGLGYIRGRGVLESDTHHGYRIVDMDVPIPDNTLRLRVGSAAVNHRIRAGSQTVSLSRLAAHKLVAIQLTHPAHEGRNTQ